MSMINDALRRASTAARTQGEGVPPLPLPAAPPLLDNGAASPPLLQPMAADIPAPPVMRVEPIRKKSSLPIILGILFFFGLAAAAGVYFWIKANPTAVIAIEKNAAGRTPESSVTLSPKSDQAHAPVANRETTRLLPSNSVPTETRIKTNQQPAAAVASSVRTVAPATPVKFPPLKLQSIFYRPANPSVIINGKTLFLSDEINGVTVADIQPASVTLVLSGQTNVLTLR